MKYSMVLRCSGAGLHNGFAFQLDNVPTNKITSVTGTKTHGASWLNNANNGVESGQDYANVVVFDDVYKVLIYPGSGSFLNTYMSAPKVAYDTSNITITFINNGVAPSGGTISLSNLPQSSFNPYVIIGDSGSFDQIRSKEVHLPNRIPSKKMNNAWFGVNDDSSNPAEGRYYKTVNNLPWGLNISTSVPYMQEKVDISLGYKKFIDWATSNGNSYSNWYQAIEGFREQSKLYTK
jgi:LruC domain-containing protein